MSEIFLPQIIAFGNDSLKSLHHELDESAIIVSKNHDFINAEFYNSSNRACFKIIPQENIIVNENINELYDSAIKFISDKNPTKIIGIGSSDIIDLAMLLSYQSGIQFSAVPYGCACGMTDFQGADYTEYRKSPSSVVLCPKFIYSLGSATVVYDALACFAYAIDTLLSCSNNVIYDMAVNGAVGILNTITASFRGDVIALEKLMYHMYYCVVAHRNMTNLGTSVLNSVTSFFAQLGYPKQSLAALCIPNIMEKYICTPFSEIMRKSSVINYSESDEDCALNLIERVRNIQASMSIPRGVRAYGADESLYNELAEKSKIQRALLDNCFYGSFKFAKM